MKKSLERHLFTGDIANSIIDNVLRVRWIVSKGIYGDVSICKCPGCINYLAIVKGTINEHE